jgi:hypothetical protein
VLVANNMVLQYVGKANIEFVDDQDDEESKSEKNDEQQKVKEFLSLVGNPVFQYKTALSKSRFVQFDINLLPSILLDVELLPPNFS